MEPSTETQKVKDIERGDTFVFFNDCVVIRSIVSVKESRALYRSLTISDCNTKIQTEVGDIHKTNIGTWFQNSYAYLGKVGISEWNRIKKALEKSEALTLLIQSLTNPRPK